MAYIDDFTLSNDVNFQNRIRMAMIKAAIAVGNETPTVKPIVDGKRSTLSLAVLTRPDFYLPNFTVAAIEAGISPGNPLVSGSTDVNIDTAIASVWNEMAGVTLRD